MDLHMIELKKEIAFLKKEIKKEEERALLLSEKFGWDYEGLLAYSCCYDYLQRRLLLREQFYLQLKKWEDEINEKK